MNRQYVEKAEGVYRLPGTRVSLDSIVHAFWRGQTAESIAQSFPVLRLEEVYGALTFYLANKPEVDAYLDASPFRRVHCAPDESRPDRGSAITGVRRRRR